MKKSITLFAIFIAIVSCSKLLPKPVAPEETLGEPLEGLTPSQLALHIEGDEQFAKKFSQAEGLGPIFVQASCENCHAGDGKGNPFNNLTRFGKYDTSGAWNPMLLQGGPQLQHRSISGYSPEQVPAGTASSQFIAPSAGGLGFLEAVNDAALLALADSNDANADGISGIVHWVNPPPYFIPKASHVSNSGKYIGRFGRKAGSIDLLQQTAGAYRNDMGITSPQEMTDPINYAVSSQNGDNVADPEISGATVNAVAFYLRTLKAPPRRNADDPDVIAGSTIFVQTGCAKCHTPSMTTGPSEIEPLNYKTFSPYTDLLLHDMGAGLDDGYAENSAKTFEWRTPPLWGLGIQETMQGGQMFLLHDGRAKTFEEAILLHGGEGANSKNNFNSLSSSDKDKLIKFLKSL